MYRVYCKIGRYRYYWSKARTWTMWSRTAQPMSLIQAEWVAQTKHAVMEPIGE